MERDRDEPLYPEDITGAGQSGDAIRRDVDEALRSIRESGAGGEALFTNMAASQAVSRIAGTVLLHRLEEMGEAGASRVREELESIDPETEPLASDLSAVAFRFDEERAKEDDPNVRQELKRLGAVAQAVSAMATAQAVNTVGKSKPETVDALLDYASETVDAAHQDLPEHTATALELLMQEVRAEIKPDN